MATLWGGARATARSVIDQANEDRGVYVEHGALVVIRHRDTKGKSVGAAIRWQVFAQDANGDLDKAWDFTAYEDESAVNAAASILAHRVAS